MDKIKITQVKSGIDRSERQKLTLKALGLNKLHAVKEVAATPQILGMVRKVNHLVTVENLGTIPEPVNEVIAIIDEPAKVEEPAALSIEPVASEVAPSAKEEEAGEVVA